MLVETYAITMQSWDYEDKRFPEDGMEFRLAQIGMQAWLPSRK